MRSKRKIGKHKPFCYFTLHFELWDLINNPDKTPTSCELLTLEEYGVTIEEFRKHHKWFKKAYEKSSGGNPKQEFFFIE
jgi:hypothetical protein